MTHPAIEVLVKNWQTQWLELDETFTCVSAMPNSSLDRYRVERNKNSTAITVRHTRGIATIRQAQVPNVTLEKYDQDLLDNLSSTDVAFLQLVVERTLEVY